MQQPGFFEYYKPADEVKSVEEGKVLNQIAKSIAKTHAEIEQIDADIEKSSAPSSVPIVDFPLNSMSQWFDLYGRPKVSDEQKDLLTAFVPSPKIYGGTSHHRSFKTQSSIMRSGRLTR